MKIQWFCRNIYALSGYSDEARGMIGALKNCGYDVSVAGKNKYPWMEGYSFQESVDPDIPIVYHTFRHADYQMVPNQYSIVRTMLEVDRIPPNWVHKLNRADEVWVPSRFNHETFIRSGADPSRIFVIHSPMEPSSRLPGNPFVLPTKKKFIFLSLFDHSARSRKGLDILLGAYVESFGPGDDVSLVIKSKTTLSEIKSEYSLGDEIPEICVINRVLDQSEYRSLFEACDCFVLPARGEGICRPIMAAMNNQVPVITTGWGGQCEYVNDRNAFLIDYRLSDVPLEGYLKNPGFFGARWAEPNSEHLKVLMREVVDKPENAKSKIRQAKKDMALFCGNHTGEQMASRFRNPLPKNPARANPSFLGDRLYPIHQACGDCQLFSDNIRIGLVGGGVPLRRAVHFFNDQKIYFRQMEISEISSLLKDPVGIIVIADFLKNIPLLYHEIMERVSSVPIFVFDF